MEGDQRTPEPNADGSGLPIVVVEGSQAIALRTADVERVRLLVEALEQISLASLNLLRVGNPAKAASGLQTIRGRLARWGGQLSGIKERLENGR